MNAYKVIVKSEGKPNHSVEVEAESYGGARSKAMISYPHKLAGAMVDFEVKKNVNGSWVVAGWED